MYLPNLKDENKNSGSFNLTPMIDVIFLLIIFFMLVCQFIVAENFEISVPDKITNSTKTLENAEQRTTVSVLFEANTVTYAVGSEKIPATSANIAEAIMDAINRSLANQESEKRIVNLRIGKELRFSQYCYALEAIAYSNATDMQLATFKDNRSKISE